MFIDASAIVAILRRAPTAEPAKVAIDAAKIRYTSALAIFEATVSLAQAKLPETADRKPTGDEIRAAGQVIAAFVTANSVNVVGVSPQIGARAVEAAATFGKAVGHPADLNFGDCFAYACAAVLRQPLLFVGDDFSQTDIRARIK